MGDLDRIVSVAESVPRRDLWLHVAGRISCPGPQGVPSDIIRLPVERPVPPLVRALGRLELRGEPVAVAGEAAANNRPGSGIGDSRLRSSRTQAACRRQRARTGLHGSFDRHAVVPWPVAGVFRRSRSAARKHSPSPGFTRENKLNSLVGPTLTLGRGRSCCRGRHSILLWVVPARAGAQLSQPASAAHHPDRVSRGWDACRHSPNSVTRPPIRT